MSEDTLCRAFRINYWRINELQLILCDFPSSMIQSEIDKLERREAKLIAAIGFHPEP